jgi:Holliday junction resolvase
MVNVRQKGAGGEREIADDLNYIIYSVQKELGCDNPTMQSVQRNQNQSAVGGADLTGTLGLSIEVKRQEQLSVNTWWEQCTTAAKQNGGIPVLLYRQNGKKWKCVMYFMLPLNGQNQAYIPGVRAETDYDTFKMFFRTWVKRYLDAGGKIVV